MRVATRGNLTVELIRLERFGGARFDAPGPTQARRIEQREPCHNQRVDRVELSREALASDPCRAAYRLPQDAQTQDDGELKIEPDKTLLTPVVGSPALAGLGVALVVPGTLLDVVA